MVGSTDPGQSCRQLLPSSTLFCHGSSCLQFPADYGPHTHITELATVRYLKFRTMLIYCTDISLRRVSKIAYVQLQELCWVKPVDRNGCQMSPAQFGLHVGLVYSPVKSIHWIIFLHCSFSLPLYTFPRSFNYLAGYFRFTVMNMKTEHAVVAPAWEWTFQYDPSMDSQKVRCIPILYKS